MKKLILALTAILALGGCRKELELPKRKPKTKPIPESSERSELARKQDGVIFANGRGEYENLVYKREKENQFRPFKGLDCALSEIETIMTAIKNMKLIKEVDEAHIDNLKKDYVPLKKLLTKLNKIYNSDFSYEAKAESLYDCISDHITSGDHTPDAESIELLVNGLEGDCNDIAPAFFSLFNYYNVKTHLRFGKAIDKDGYGYHVWLSVCSKDTACYDLDPTWYGSFIKLEERHKDIEKVMFKGEYMRHKKPKRLAFSSEIKQKVF